MDQIDVTRDSPFATWSDVLATKSPAVAALASTPPPGVASTPPPGVASTPTGVAYDLKRPAHLIRFERNQQEHFNKLVQDAQGHLGKSIEDFFCFFDDLFPHLLIQTYRVFQIHYFRIRSAFPDDPTVQGAAEYFK
ncbi:hypothetical protein C5167_022043 [Papaver somniferum]|uniref:KEN domain-containing protein n=1 Tax=Papaver somniferum TaxID=3469 RepID=A0A4Y7JJS3_PAPSO|nr:uncharacterized protein LOC113281135 [Papaver somniferum]RZC60300.1 hypothetical protein C5167_022043 [Papaver somniferum]